MINPGNINLAVQFHRIETDGTENSPLLDNLMIAWGKYTPQIFVMPDQHLLVLRFGNDPYSTTNQWDEVTFLTPILNAITE